MLQVQQRYQMLNYTCSVCAQTFDLPDSLANMSIRCPHCQSVGWAPSSDGSPAPPKPHFNCPHCGCTEKPWQRSKLSVAGWIVFFLLGIFPFGLLGLLLREKYTICSYCL